LPTDFEHIWINDNMNNPDIVQALEPVVNILNELGVHYYIGGSVASSIYGTARTTLDVDIVIDLNTEIVNKLVHSLKSSYYIDEDMILDAVRTRSSFNVIHLDTMMKLDFFVFKDTPHQREAFSRIRKDTIVEEQDTAEFCFSSPEDIILSKLEWFQQGGMVSDRQWSDICGVLKIQGQSLDIEYLRFWAAQIGVLELLEKVFKDTGM